MSMFSHNQHTLANNFIRWLVSKVCVCVSVMIEVIGGCYDRLTNWDVSYEAYVNWSLSKTGEIRL